MLKGTIIRGIGGFYDIQTEQGVIRCKLRGRLRLEKDKILVGDKVHITPTANDQGVVEEVLPRVNELIRPPIANIDQVIIVMAAQEPEPDLFLLDRLLAMVAKERLPAVCCFSKCDLAEEKAAELAEIYRQCGYLALAYSIFTGEGIEEIRPILQNRISALAGPSGAGKSSLLNAIQPGLDLQVGEISAKMGRGKHTTRRVELLPLAGGGFVADTPGFSNLNMEVEPEKLGDLFPEIKEHAANCFFRGCLHRQEPDCGVKQGVSSGEIPQHRYKHYLLLLEEAQEKRRYW